MIRLVYDRDSSQNPGLLLVQTHGLVQVVKEIAKDEFSIPEEIRGRVIEMKEYTKNWLDQCRRDHTVFDQYMRKHVSENPTTEQPKI